MEMIETALGRLVPANEAQAVSSPTHSFRRLWMHSASRTRRSSKKRAAGRDGLARLSLNIHH